MGWFLPILAKTVLGGVAAKVLGGKQETTQSVNYQALRDNAQAAGFNPLTALRNGGSNNVRSSGPNLSSQAFIYDAINSGVDTWFNRESIARDEQVEMIKLETMREELNQLQKRGRVLKGGGFGWEIPSAKINDDAGVYTPQMSAGDDDAAQERIVGVNMPFDAGQRNEDAGGDIVGGLQTMGEWVYRAGQQLGTYSDVLIARSRGEIVHKVKGKYYIKRPNTVQRVPAKRPKLTFNSPNARVGSYGRDFINDN